MCIILSKLGLLHINIYQSWGKFYQSLTIGLAFGRTRSWCQWQGRIDGTLLQFLMMSPCLYVQVLGQVHVHILFCDSLMIEGFVIAKVLSSNINKMVKYRIRHNMHNYKAPLEALPKLIRLTKFRFLIIS